MCDISNNLSNKYAYMSFNIEVIFCARGAWFISEISTDMHTTGKLSQSCNTRFLHWKFCLFIDVLHTNEFVWRIVMKYDFRVIQYSVRNKNITGVIYLSNDKWQIHIMYPWYFICHGPFHKKKTSGVHFTLNTNLFHSRYALYSARLSNKCWTVCCWD